MPGVSLIPECPRTCALFVLYADWLSPLPASSYPVLARCRWNPGWAQPASRSQAPKASTGPSAPAGRTLPTGPDPGVRGENPWSRILWLAPGRRPPDLTTTRPRTGSRIPAASGAV